MWSMAGRDRVDAERASTRRGNRPNGLFCARSVSEHAPVVARILVVDDEPRMVAFLARVLTAEGWAGDATTDGGTGLRMARTGIYDLVLLDLILQDADGVTLLAELMADQPEQPVLVLSAVSDVEDRVRCLRLGAADYLVKPFAISELVA